jgi:carbamoyltransferase
MAEVIDIQPYVEHDPLIGHRYTPYTQLTLPRPGGGDYELVINGAGIRSTREYEKRKPQGVLRMLVFGDSFAAGQFVSNDQRFSELLERRVPGLEVINFGLESTGTDQQLLLYENVGREFEHDIVMVLPFLQNIRRNMVEARIAIDPKSRQEVLRPKPRFELVNGDLVLRNVPVPNTRVANSGNAIDQTDTNRGTVHQFKAMLSRSPTGKVLKEILFQIKPWEPFPEYRNASSPQWQLMEAILRRFKEAAGARPLVIVPIFYDSYVRFRMARNYWKRFRSLEGPGTYVIDLLPHFQRLTSQAVRCFQGPYDCHFSPYGHLVVADALQEELNRRGLLPSIAAGDLAR